MINVSESDLKNELRDFRERYRNLQDHELFVCWFLRSTLTDSDTEAVGALVGGPKDKSFDAVLIDDRAKAVFLVQGKYRSKLNQLSEHRSDIMSFANLAHDFANEDAFKNLLKNISPEVAGKIQEARGRVIKRGYRLHLYYVSTGKCSSDLRSEAQRSVRRAPYPSMIEVMAGKQVMRVLSDYLDGVAPPVPLLDLEMESGRGVRLSGILQRFDGNTQIESWVFPVTVNNIVDMYEKSGIRLFARNIRGFLGSTKVNRNMEVTLETEPEFFWYYNNGITIVCDAAERLSSGGRDIVRVTNPQVINGQQTTRTLHRTAPSNSRASVLVRVISVPRDDESDGVRFEKLVSKIVAATNWQNQIRASDLRVNDRRQIEIERNFRKIDYQYLRKRQTKGEARREAGVRHRFLISKEELAQAVAACDLDPAIVRGGKERLFEERNYFHVFPNADPLYYLARFWLADHVAYAAKGFPERAYAKWLVVHFMWHNASPLMASRSYKDAFRR
jgi:hypothetical protein